MAAANATRIAILNKDTSDLESKIVGIDYDVFVFLWDVSLLKVKVSSFDSEDITVTMGGKIGKSKVKIAAPIELWQLALKVAPLYRMAINKYFELTGSDVFADGKVLVITPKVKEEV